MVLILFFIIAALWPLEVCYVSSYLYHAAAIVRVENMYKTENATELSHITKIDALPSNFSKQISQNFN